MRTEYDDGATPAVIRLHYTLFSARRVERILDCVAFLHPVDIDTEHKGLWGRTAVISGETAATKKAYRILTAGLFND